MNPFSLYPITDPEMSRNGDVLADIEAICKGGAKVVQLREKHSLFKNFLETAQKARIITQNYGVKLIVNDNLRVAFFAEADGIHLGQKDVPIQVARKILGKKAIIGATAKTIEQAFEAIEAGADYLGTGALFFTRTHRNPIIIGPEGYEEVRSAVHWKYGDRVPVIAIGGINEKNLEEVLNLQADGVAMVSAIVGATKVEKKVQDLLQKIHSFGNKSNEPQLR